MEKGEKKKTFRSYCSDKYHQSTIRNSVLSSDHSLSVFLSCSLFVQPPYSPQRKRTKVLSLVIVSSNPAVTSPDCPSCQTLPNTSTRDLRARQGINQPRPRCCCLITRRFSDLIHERRHLRGLSPSNVVTLWQYPSCNIPANSRG